MDKNLFETIDPVVDDIAEQIGELTAGEAMGKLKERLSELSRSLGEDYSLSLEFNLQVFCDERENNLPLLQTGLASFNGAAPYQIFGDSTTQRYIVNGDIVVVPHDHCPNCWGCWDGKESDPTCPDCGFQLGEEVKVLLDSDCCPNCERGTVTTNSPKCPECGFTVNLDYVVWG